MSRPALFLDRDGVINVDHAYVHQKENFEFIDGIFDLCQKAEQAGYLIIVITNQAGIGRGYYSEKDFDVLTEWMTSEFEKNNVTINAVYHCPYHPEKGIDDYKKDAPCRKPNPGMILKAKAQFDIDLESSLLVGDKNSDIQAGLNAGIGKNILFTPEKGKQYMVDIAATASVKTHSETEAFL